jgi:hypothetical protein
MKDQTLAEELNMDIKQITADKYKTTDLVTFKYFEGRGVSRH